MKNLLFKKVLSLVLAVCLAFGTLSQVAWAATPESAPNFTYDSNWYNGHEEGSVFNISNAAELAYFAYLVNSGTSFEGKTVTLDSGIDLSGEYASGKDSGGWIPIGTSSNAFQGTFNGAGYIISNLTINRPTALYQGLFGIVYGTVKNLGVVNADVVGGPLTGGLAGAAKSIQNCFVTGKVRATEGKTALTGSGVGGLTGYLGGGTIENCYTSCEVKVVGYGGTIYAGGIVGNNVGRIKNCYASGSVKASSCYGGAIASYQNNNVQSNCYFDTDQTGWTISPVDKVGQSNGMTGLTTAQMTDDSTLLSGGKLAGLDTAAWEKSSNDGTENYYPELKIFANSTSEDSRSASRESVTEKPSSAYDIADAFDLANFSTAVTLGNPYSGKTVRLVNDINLNDLNVAGKQVSWYPIGTYAKQFLGTFDGQNHIISNLYQAWGGRGAGGLFGPLGNTGLIGTVCNVTVKNLTLANVSVCMDTSTAVQGAADNTGALAAYSNTGAIIENCHVTGAVGAMAQYTGGLVGKNDGGTIWNSSFFGTITGINTQTAIGGIAGLNSSTIEQCFVKANISVTRTNSNIQGSYSSVQTGGLVGILNVGTYSSTDPTVQNSYFIGKIMNYGDYAGGLVGNAVLGSIENCYASARVIDWGFDPQYTDSAIYSDHSGALIGLETVKPTGSAGMPDKKPTLKNCYFNQYATEANGCGNHVDMSIGMSGSSTYARGATDDIAAEMHGLTFDAITASDAPAAMNLPADIWSKRANDGTFHYYPELKGCAESADTGVAEISKASVKTGVDFSWYTGKASPYTITTGAQLAALSTLVNGGYDRMLIIKRIDGTNDWYSPQATQETVKLGNDIDLAAYYGSTDLAAEELETIGTTYNAFCGVFDGNSHIISNLKINKPSENYQALFGAIASYSGTRNVFGGSYDGGKGVVKNLGVTNVDIQAGFYSGALQASSGQATHRRCGYSTTTRQVSPMDESYSYGGLENCYSTGKVVGADYIGGLASTAGSLKNCFSTVRVETTQDNGKVAGLAVFATFLLKNCYSTGMVVVQGVNKASPASGEGLCMGGAGNVSLSISDNYFAGRLKAAGQYALLSERNATYVDNTLYGLKQPYLPKFLTTPRMTAQDTLTNTKKMSSLGTADWVKPDYNDGKYYYPELSVFHNSSNPQIVADSKISVLAKDYSDGSEDGKDYAATLRTVTFNPNGGSGDSVTRQVVSGDYLGENMPTDPTRNGGYISGWNTKADGTGTAFTATTSVTADMMVYAQWTASVTFISNGTYYKSNLVTMGQSIGTNMPAVPTRNGYTFGGWFTGENGAGDELNGTTVINADMTVYAKWTSTGGNTGEETRTVTFVSNGTPYTTKTVTSGECLGTNLPTVPTREGYTFGGWFTGENGTGVGLDGTTVINADTTVYAKWISAAAARTVTFISNGTSYATKTVTSGERLGTNLPTEPTREGYTFGGWFTGENGTGVGLDGTTVINADTTVYAKWTPNGGGTVSDTKTVLFISGGEVYHTKEITSGQSLGSGFPAAPTRDGYTFGGWFTGAGGTGVELKDTAIITSDVTVYAEWTKDGGTGGVSTGTNTVVFISNGQVYTTKEVTQNQSLGGSLPTAPSLPGYIFGGWFTGGNGGGIELTGTTTVTADITVYAKWTKNSGIDDGGPSSGTKTVIFISDGKVHDTKQVTSGQSLSGSLPADPTLNGSLFGGWFTGVNGTGIELTGTTVITANATVYAKWSNSSGGTEDGGTSGTKTIIFVNEGKVYATKQITSGGNLGRNFPSSPTRDGYVFSGWFTGVNGTGVELKGTTVLSGDATVYARWTKSTGDSSGGSSGGSHSGGSSGSPATSPVAADTSKTITVLEAPKEIGSPSRISVVPVGEAFDQSIEVRLKDDSTTEAIIRKSLVANLPKTPSTTWSVFPLDISMYIKGTETKVQPKEGTAVKITCPIPSTFLADKDRLFVISLKDGKLEVLSTTVVTIDGDFCVEFTAKHFSPYAFVVDYDGSLAKLAAGNTDSGASRASTPGSTGTGGASQPGKQLTALPGKAGALDAPKTGDSGNDVLPIGALGLFSLFVSMIMRRKKVNP